MNTNAKKILYDQHNILKWETHEYSRKHLADQNRLIEMKIREGKEERLSYAFLPCVYYNWGMDEEELNHYFN